MRMLYNDGVRFGSWGMSVYSISCSMYSYNIQKLNDYFGKYSCSNDLQISLKVKHKSSGIKRVYIGSQIIYSIGMFLMGVFRHRLGVIVLSAVAGILYSTLFTIPYLLISKYHTLNVVRQRFERLTRCFPIINRRYFLFFPSLNKTIPLQIINMYVALAQMLL